MGKIPFHTKYFSNIGKLTFNFLILILTYATINPIIISTLKVSKAINTNEKAKLYLDKKLSNKPILIKGKLLIESIYKNRKYDWPRISGLPNAASYYLRWSLAPLFLLFLFLFNREKVIKCIENIANLIQEKNEYSRQIRIFYIFVFFSFFTWILRLHWGFWFFGIFGWNLKYSQNLIPYELKNEKYNQINYSDQKILDCYGVTKKSLLQALDKESLPSEKKLINKSNDGIYLLNTEFYVGLSEEDEYDTTLISDGAFGFVFPTGMKVIRDKQVTMKHLNILDRRLKNYQNFGGPFRLSSKIAYPSHTPYNKEFTNIVKKINRLSLWNITYKIDLQNKKVNLYSANFISGYPKCLN